MFKTVQQYQKLLKKAYITIIILLIAVILLVASNIYLFISQQNKMLVSQSGRIYQAVKSDRDFRTRAEIISFSKNVTNLLFGYSYKDFVSKNRNTKKSKIYSAMQLMTKPLAQNLNQYFYGTRKNDITRAEEIKRNKRNLKLKIEKVNVIKHKKKPYEVNVYAKNWIADQRKSTKSNIKINYQFDTTERVNENQKPFGPMGLKVISYSINSNNNRG